MAKMLSDDLLLVNRDETTYTAPGEAIFVAYDVKEPPVIGNVSLVENNPGKDARFTGQQFTSAVSMTNNGEPESEKTFDAYVEGTFFTNAQFVEPLESSTLTQQGVYSSYCQSTLGFQTDQYLGFDGDLTTAVIANQAIDGSPSGVVFVEFATAISGDLEVYFENSGTGFLITITHRFHRWG